MFIASGSAPAAGIGRLEVTDNLQEEDRTTLFQQVGRAMGEALVFAEDTKLLWFFGVLDTWAKDVTMGADCCGHRYVRFGWFNKHRRNRHR